MRKLTRKLSEDRGLTVVELMIASGLFLVLIGSVLSVLDSGARTERISQARHDALLDLRQAMTQMTKEVRQAISVAPTSTQTTLDIQTLLSGVQHHIVYDVAGASPDAVLRRAIDGGPPKQLTDRIVAPLAFCYQFDDPNCLRTSPDPATLSSIRISLTLDPVVFAQGSITIATDVQLRNLRSGG